MRTPPSPRPSRSPPGRCSATPPPTPCRWPGWRPPRSRTAWTCASVSPGGCCRSPTPAGRLLTTGEVDAWLAAAACAGADPLELDAEADARCPSAALRQASRRLGRGLRRAAVASWPSLAGGPGAEHQAVVQGLVARAAGLSPSDAARLPGAALLAGAASATPKLLPLDTADAMAVATR